tara:strand:+ start:494 stop:622 length:129 start_codon:yes stop_codon:yes gene_type:complete
MKIDTIAGDSRGDRILDEDNPKYGAAIFSIIKNQIENPISQL